MRNVLEERIVKGMQELQRIYRRGRIGERSVAWLLVFVMVLGMLPANILVARAEGDTTTSNNLRDFIIGASLEGEDIEIDGDTWKTVRSGVTYRMHLSFKENPDLQFVENNTAMTYTLPDGVIASEGGMIDITVNNGDKSYTVHNNPFTVSDGGKKISLTLNRSDPNIAELDKTSNAEIELIFDANFNLSQGDNTIAFGGDVTKTVTADNEHNAAVEKTGWFDSNNGKMYYTITVTSEGVSNGVTITDTLSGDALKLDQDSIKVEEDGVSLQNVTKSDTGFTATIDKIDHDKTVTITYSASVDPTKVGANGKITTEQPNTVAIACDEDKTEDDNTATYTSPENTLTVTSFQGKSGSVDKGDDSYAEIDGNKATIHWTIRLNNERLIALSGYAITDTLQDEGQNYSGEGITISKTDKAGTTTTESKTWAELGIDPAAATSWSYTPDDTTPYFYEITYTTTKDVGDQLSDVTAKNKVEYRDMSTEGTANIGINPDNKFTMDKSVVDFDSGKVEWKIEINVPAGGYSDLTVTDTYPKLSAVGAVESLLSGADSVTVDGLQDDEDYDLDITHADYFTMTFYKNKEHNENGLNPSTTSRTITIHVITKVDENWLNYAKQNTWALGHTNTASATVGSKTVTDSATAYPQSGDVTIQKTAGEMKTVTDAEGNVYPYYQYSIIISPVNKDEIVIQDTLPEEFVFYTSPKGTEWLPEKTVNVYGGDQYYQGSPSDNTTITLGSDGTITAKNLPKNGEAYYSHYRIEYRAIVKDANALKELNQKAVAGKGSVQLTNTAKYDSVTASCKVDYKIGDDVVLDKKLLNENALSAENHNAEYQITINPKGLKLNNGNPITLTDEFTKLSLDYSTIQFTPADAVLSYNVQGTKLTAVLKDELPIY